MEIIDVLFPCLIIFFLIIASITALTGPRWMIWISIGCGFLLGITLGMMIYDYPSCLLFGIIFGTISGIFLGGSGFMARLHRQKGRERLQEAINYLNKPELAVEDFQSRLSPGEQLLIKSPAKHFRQFDGIGGQLHLTNKRLIFIPNTLHYQKYELSIPLKSIVQVEPYKINMVINKGMAVILRDRKPERFLISSRMEWIEKIDELKSTT